jgi:hypothetical protein
LFALNKHFECYGDVSLTTGANRQHRKMLSVLGSDLRLFFREVCLMRRVGTHPRLSCCELSLVTPPTLAEDVREVDHEKAPFRSRGRQMFALLNSEATKRDVDKWTEDLLNRIQLCIMHPHSVIHQNSAPSEGALELCEMGLGERRSL